MNWKITFKDINEQAVSHYYWARTRLKAIKWTGFDWKALGLNKSVQCGSPWGFMTVRWRVHNIVGWNWFKNVSYGNNLHPPSFLWSNKWTPNTLYWNKKANVLTHSFSGKHLVVCDRIHKWDVSDRHSTALWVIIKFCYLILCMIHQNNP